MKEAQMQARLKELYLPPTEDFVLLEVPEMRYVMIDGHGAADRATLDHAVKWLFAVIHPIKSIARERMGENFVQPPLEGLWWADDVQDFIHGNRDRLHWRMMIVYEPDWLTAEMFEDALSATKARLGATKAWPGDPPASLRLESYREGLSVQIMHVGPPVAETETLARLHAEFLPARNLVPNGHHHEIYLTDPNRVAPEKQRTVLRQPVRRIS
ncbi:MAG: GyrI-like domain-containing protein [Phycisphaerales bacterium]|nr:GyrI-like domain-containing protein [Phycisphaerales bacterium]